jgi:hypothetical protein
MMIRAMAVEVDTEAAVVDMVPEVAMGQVVVDLIAVVDASMIAVVAAAVVAVEAVDSTQGDSPIMVGMALVVATMEALVLDAVVSIVSHVAKGLTTRVRAVLTPRFRAVSMDQVTRRVVSHISRQ